MKIIKRVSLDKILKALGDPVRISVIKQLLSAKDKEISCGDFQYSVQKATFSHHVKVLLESNILCERIEGVRKYLSISPDIEKNYPDILNAIKRSE